MKPTNMIYVSKLMRELVLYLMSWKQSGCPPKPGTWRIYDGPAAASNFLKSSGARRVQAAEQEAVGVGAVARGASSTRSWRTANLSLSSLRSTMVAATNHLGEHARVRGQGHGA
jgi:hypothetical protein